MRGTCVTIAGREFRRHFRTPAGFVFLTAFLLLASWLFFDALFATGQATLQPLFSLAPWLLVLFVPTVGMRLWTEERRTGTDELLLTLPVLDGQVVLGKFLGSLGFIAFALVLTFPLPALVALLGDPDPGPLVSGYIGLALLGAAYVSITLFASCAAGRRMSAFIAAVVAAFALTLVGEDFVLAATPRWLTPLLQHVGLARRLDSMSRGVLDSRDVVHFLSVAAFFLYGSVMLVARRGGATGRRGRTRRSAAAGAAGLAAVLVVAALLSRQWYVRLDLTERNDYSVSGTSIEVLEDLDDIATLTAYLSSDLPAHMIGFRPRVEDILSQYRARGGGNLLVRFVDPATDPELEERVRSLGIRPVELEPLGSSVERATPVYSGFTIAYEGRVEVVPLLLDPGRLEYELTSALVALTAPEAPVVGFLTGHGEGAPTSSYSRAAAELETRFRVREIDPETGSSAFEELDVLIVAGADEVPDVELFAVDQFLMRGGRALFLLDAVAIERENTAARVATGNVYDYVSRYGAEVRPELVVDLVSGNASFPTGSMAMGAPYPFWPKAVTPNISQVHPVVSGLRVVSFPWTSPVERSRYLPESVDYEPLVRSSDRSWAVPPRVGIEPEGDIEPPPELAGDVRAGLAPGHDLVVALSGMFESAFRGSPVLVIDAGGGVTAMDPPGRLNMSEPTQMIVVGNSRMFSDELFAQAASSPVLFLNAVDWLAHGRRLIDVRTKLVDSRPLGEVSEAGRRAVLIAGVFAVPLVVVALGLTRSWTRRRRAGRPHARRTQ